MCPSVTCAGWKREEAADHPLRIRDDVPVLVREHQRLRLLHVCHAAPLRGVRKRQRRRQP